MSRDERSTVATGQLNLKAGDWVEVRSKEEILRTLDARGELENMPFMPEMLAYCGRRLPVIQTAHKTCDTIDRTGGRRVTNAVHLDQARCDGAGHDGCGAQCLLFWKEAWLKRADAGEAKNAHTGDAHAGGAHAAPPMAAPGTMPGGCTERDLAAAAKKPGASAGEAPTYSCQATEVLRASTPLPWWDVRQYVEDYRSGNVGLRQLAEGLAYSIAGNAVHAAKDRPRIQRAMVAAYDRFQALRGGLPFPRKTGAIPAGQKTPPCVLDLKEGELVRVKSHEEVLATLDTDSKNRGLYFDAECVPYCGGTFRVLSRVNKIVDEKTGKMVTFKNPSVILDGAWCRAKYSDRRMFCPRALYPYFREAWLERVDGAKDPVAPAPG